MKCLTNFNKAWIVFLAGIPLLFSGCLTDNNIEGNYTTKTEDLIGEYLQHHPESFSEFTSVLDTTGVLGLLNAYGLYTCFIPTNEAMRRYYEADGKTSMKDYTLEELKNFCYNHIIKGDTLRTIDFNEGALSSLTMSERFISIHFSDTSSTIFINGKSPIIEPDIKLHNGYLHVLGRAIEPSRSMLGEIFVADPKFSIFAKAFTLTGYQYIMDNTPAEDLSFDPDKDTRALMTHTVLEERPKSRKIGFTIIAPSDSILAKYTECPACPNGVHSLADLEKVAEYYYSKAFPDGEGITDYKDKRNYLNRFVAYHCFDRTLLDSRFIKDYDTPHHFKQYDMHEYIETMLQNSLLEVMINRNFKDASKRYELGLINSMENPSKAVFFTNYTNKPDGGAKNGYYHEITKPVIFSEEVMSDIMTKRLRIDGSAFFPELATNNMRGNNPTAVAAVPGKTHAYLLPNGYLADMTCSEDTRFTYIGACEAYEDYQGDELYLRGTYNFSFKTCPIPPGTYEIRMGYQPTAYRGIAQLYWDSVPCGIPLNLSLYATDPEIGYETPGSNKDDPYGYENDKMMRNRGYMKGPCSYYCSGHWYGYDADNARLSRQSLRRILGTYKFTEWKEHTFTVISLGSTSNDTQFMLDYLEFCPTELLEHEGID